MKGSGNNAGDIVYLVNLVDARIRAKELGCIVFCSSFICDILYKLKTFFAFSSLLSVRKQRNDFPSSLSLLEHVAQFIFETLKLRFLFQQNYLMKFGYLPQTDLETGNLRTDDQLTDAIENLQVSEIKC